MSCQLHPQLEVGHSVGSHEKFETKQAGQKMIAHIDKKRKALGIDKARERVLYDMAMRRELT